VSRSAAFLPWLLVFIALGAAGCGGKNSEGPPRLTAGEDVCAECGMTLGDLHYAAAMREGDRVLIYDSIECLARARRKAGGTVSDRIWMADFETVELHPQSAMTVVQAGYPSPMGGGFAAFADPAQARSEAAAKGGVTGTLADVVSGALQRTEAR